MSVKYGDTPGVAVGDIFPDRTSLRASGVHRQLQAGISWYSGSGADSIVLSGGYEDDRDQGDSISYTGHGGNDRTTGKQEANQQLQRGNLELARSCLTGLPVRVIRGSRDRSPWSPPFGFQYSGLFRVDSFWSEIGLSNWVIWRFALERLGDGERARPGKWLAEDEETYDSSESGPAPRQPAFIQRIVRTSALAAVVKALYEHECQVCGERIMTAAGPYKEAAHIQPLGKPHDGPDELSNLLCLCPNHDVMCDLGGFIVGETGAIINPRTGAISGVLSVSPQHQLDPKRLPYHRRLFQGDRVNPF